MKPEEQAVSPLKITIKPVLKPEDTHTKKHSPKLTIKPIIKPDEVPESKVHSPRVTIKPIIKPNDENESAVSPRVTIKPIKPPAEEVEHVLSPRVTIKPIKPPTEEVEQVLSPRVTIKPIKPPSDEMEQQVSSPRITIKPIIKPTEAETVTSSPKITIKPIPKPQELEENNDDELKERIVLKINKGTLPHSSKEQKAKPEEEKLAKIKLKFSKEGRHAQIVHEKRPSELEYDRVKRSKVEHESTKVSTPPNVTLITDDDDDLAIVETQTKFGGDSPIVISEDSNQDSINQASVEKDPISEIPVFEIRVPVQAPSVVAVTPPTPRKRGRPRKV